MTGQFGGAIKRFTRLPVTLYRIQARLPVALRDYQSQTAKGRTSYDLTLHNGLVLPAQGDTWIGPNGMSLRPRTEKMISILREFKGEPTIYALLEGMRLPPDLVLLHEHSDHYSLQTAVPIELPHLNSKLTALMQSLTSQTKQQFLQALEDEDDQDN
eukprot:c45891_g1_i1.p1 GENE.c45891_g1_i1~~c45891_g1_i1.p1  ORF type:complete len:166 (+),score=33.38 c45891_g1_i1:29-499(+)